MMSFPFISIQLFLIAAILAPPQPPPTVSLSPTIEYLRTVPSVREFTKPRGFFSKMVTLLAGTDEDKPEHPEDERELIFLPEVEFGRCRHSRYSR